MKKTLILVVTVISISSLLTGCGCNKKNAVKEEKPAVNTNKDVVKDQTVSNFSFTKTSLIYVGGNSTLVTTVKNNSTKTEYIKTFNIISKDSQGNIINKMIGYIGEEIKPGEVRQITSQTDLDLSKAVSIEYTINK